MVRPGKDRSVRGPAPRPGAGAGAGTGPGPGNHRTPADRPVPWHALPVERCLEILGTDGDSGLAATEAARRLRRYGSNQLREARRDSLWRKLAVQFQGVLVLVLVGAAALSAALGEQADAITILVIVIVNALLGFLHEHKAEQALEALKALAAPQARVVRDGHRQVVPAADLVPGDLILVEAGDRIPADARLLESHSLAVEEAALTGESRPVGKAAGAACAPDASLAERPTMVYQGTTVTRGRARAVVVATGMATEMGRIAGLLEAAETEPTPLQQRLAHLGRVLVTAALAVCAVVVVLGVIQGEGLASMFLAGVSLAVAAVPEGLPAVVTIVLALGVQRMVQAHAIIRRLPAVETLGCATVICSDKTGTLTENRMTARRAVTASGAFGRSGEGEPWRPDPAGPVDRAGIASPARPDGHGAPGGDEPAAAPGEAGRPDPGAAAAELRRLLEAVALCNNAVPVSASDDPAGDPTEVGLVKAAWAGGIDARRLQRERPRVAEHPFSSERRRMAVVCRDQRGRRTSYVKGAPEVVLERCRFLLRGDGPVPLTGTDRQRMAATAAAMAEQALRVLAVAVRPLDPGQDPEDERVAESDLVLVGLVGLMDPPRPEVPAAVERCRRAGIRPVMVTGDHARTAAAIGRELGLLGEADPVVEGRELEALDDEQLARRVAEVNVFARVAPEHKLRIVRALKRQGAVVGMTGDGVNDAPALKEAHIGIAMGRTGTDVTREAADMILTDDNFASIVAAVEQGRAIYDNIRKFIRYLLACNTGEILVMFLALLAGLPLPLRPIHILLVNLVTDGLPAVALGLEPAEPDVMNRPPRHPRESLFAGGLGRRVVVRGVIIGLTTLTLFVLGSAGGDLERGRTMALAGLVLSQMLHVFDCRSERRSAFDVPLSANPALAAAVASSVAVLLAVIYWEPLARSFYTVPLRPGDWVMVLGAVLLPWVALVVRRHLPGGPPRAVQAGRPV
ncbi:ATPase, P-type (transporting), HAD superfamily, subfamily IC [Thermaerobacter marianensis DSM 12885]|uniref:P-type Ca(2+) transporter n=1 Tax=Thermaerobacter marianensis (strain ATCC 700841 / DSM 12885 / JCM 10246 / 7p75a) TaxID=644966 RepID=E6SJ94_THEM7|nr:cation-translocating P-type ATPase [Thermaerobacter marianensis]ADU51022.1 ATPase, P-type (transporting), HAD superfamily, subfamily IC [Thermaerobacter marianensis DSM 12885]